MNHRNMLVNATLLVLLSGTGMLHAADGDKASDKAEKRERKEEARVSKPDKRTMEHIEQLNGKALNEEQMKTVQSAWEKRDAARKASDEAFKAEMAGALGLTAEQMASKEKELRAAARKDNPTEAKKEGDAKPADKPARE